MTETVQQPFAAAPTSAPLDPRQLLLPAMHTMAEDLIGMLPPADMVQALQSQQLLQQMLMATDVLQMHSLTKLMQAMDAVLRTLTQISETAPNPKAGELLQLAMRDALAYLHSQQSAQPASAQTLFSSYRALTKLQGKDTSHPADLWENAWPLPQLPAPQDMAPTEPSAALRSQLDQHVLALLKAPDAAACATLRDISAGLAAHVHAQGQDSTVWQLASAWLDTLSANVLELDLFAKRLLSRLLTQYGELSKGQYQAPALLLRDLLFFCAQATEATLRQNHPLPEPLLRIQRSCSLQATTATAAPSEEALVTASAIETPAQDLPKPPPLAPALPEFEAAPEITPSAHLVQGLATSAQMEPDSEFLKAAEDLSSQLEGCIQTWMAEEDGLLPPDAVAHAQELSRIAWASGCTEIATLSHLLQRCLARMPQAATSEQRRCCHYATEEINRLLHQFAAGFMRRAHPQVSDALQQLCAQLPEPATTPQPAAVPEPLADPDAPFVLQVPEEAPAATEPEAPAEPVATALLDPMHFSVFAEEMLGTWPALQSALKQWMQAPQDSQPRQALLRSLHTLKGSARLAGAMAWASQVHAIEGLALEAATNDGPLGPSALQQPLEALRIAFVALQQEMADRHPERGHGRWSNQPLEAVGKHTQALWSTHDASSHAMAENQLTLQEIHSSLQRLRMQIKDCAAWADTLMLHGELDLPYEWHEELQALVHGLDDCTDDLGTAQQQLEHGLATAHTALNTQGGHLRALQQTLLYARLVPLSLLQERLHSTLQLAMQDTGKSAQLQWQGLDTMMERHVADAMAPVIEHLLRNCMAHGIETAAQRTAAKKTVQGHIRLQLYNQGQQQVLTLMDDGAGLDVAAIRRKAIHLGLIDNDELVNEERAGQLILQPGLSTACTVTELAGRGVGMDVVAETIAQLGGTLRLQSRTGRGLRIVITLPPPPQVEQVLALRAGSWRVALPARAIETVRRLPAAAAQQALERGVLQDDAYGPLPLYWAGAVWQQSPRSIETPLDGQRHILVVRGETSRWGMVVDEVLGTQEVTLQPAHNLEVPIAGLLGTAAQASGHVLQVYEPAAVLFAHEARLLNHEAPAIAATDSEAESAARPLVLLADDSLSVRRLAQHLLQANGYRVITAADGLEVLNLLEQGETPSLLVVDVEMPDMDGMELLHRLRADIRWKRLPIVMLTAHAAGPVSEKALTLGAQAYLTKPYAPNELLGQVRRYSNTATSTR